MTYKKGNLVMYDGRQMTVVQCYKQDNKEYVDLRLGYKGKYFKIPVDDVYFIAEKQTKNLN